MTTGVPVFGICGPRGSGRTTLIGELIRRLAALGLKAGVIRDGVPRAGDGDVGVPLENPPGQIEPCCDLLLIETDGSPPEIPKIWLATDTDDALPPGVGDVRRILRRTDDRAGAAMSILLPWLREQWARTPLHAGVLVGGGSRRMGRPKHLIALPDGQTWIERIVTVLAEVTEGRTVLLGSGDVPGALGDLPRLLDVEGRPGPLGGMLSAMRWAPAAGWVFCACDQPLISADAIRWLLSFRRPGVWAVLPRLEEGPNVEPMLGYYDHRARWLLEDADVPRRAARSDRTLCPVVPKEHAAGWKNINTPIDLAALDAFGREDGILRDPATGEMDRR